MAGPDTARSEVAHQRPAFADASDFGRLECGCDGAEVPFYRDADEDGYGDSAARVVACAEPR